jgi:hypothetical protein
MSTRTAHLLKGRVEVSGITGWPRPNRVSADYAGKGAVLAAMQRRRQNWRVTNGIYSLDLNP